MVEIVSPTEDGRAEATGKRFAVQLKATDDAIIALRVATSKIYYWMESTERVLLVGCHAPTGPLVWRWVDDDLVDEFTRRSPSWYTQETVSISFGDRVLNSDALAVIAKDVRTLSASAEIRVDPSSPS
jgi:Domain of unknown function (DUF4365)